MINPAFFRFAGNRHVTQGRPFNGLLHFIPQPESRLPTDTPRHAAFESTDLQWLEIKENISTEGVRITKLTAKKKRAVTIDHDYCLYFETALLSLTY